MMMSSRLSWDGPASRYRSGSPFPRRWTRPVCTTPDATGVLAGVGQLRGRAMAPQGVELSAKEADHVRESESGDKEGAVEHDGGCAQTRACHHRFARLASPRAPGGDQGSPCRGRCSRRCLYKAAGGSRAAFECHLHAGADSGGERAGAIGEGGD
jgi:hypothetical protein